MQTRNQTQFFFIPRRGALLVSLALAASGLVGCASSPPPPPVAAAPAPVVAPAPAVAPEAKVKLPIVQTPRGVMVVLPDTVLFDSGKAILSSASDDYVVRLTELLNSKTKSNVLVEGHTDSVGARALNQKLSEQRATALKASLVAKGVTAERIDTRGLAFDQPIASNETDQGRRQNRRTEVTVLGETVENFTRGEHPNSFEVAFASIKNALEADIQKKSGAPK